MASDAKRETSKPWSATTNSWQYSSNSEPFGESVSSEVWPDRFRAYACALEDYARVRPEHRHRRIPFLHRWHLYETAARHGGWCLDAENNLPKHLAKAHLRWECAHGHVFLARVDNVRQGHWCPKCRPAEWTIERVEKFLIDKRIICLSTAAELVNNKSVLSFKCLKKGHVWSTTLTNITSRYSHCPCCRHKSEQYTREVLQELFGEQFMPAYPRWLRRNGNQLQLDCYSAELSIAVEFQGHQHFMVQPHIKHGIAELRELQRRDAYKRRMCKARGITFIEIPYYPKDCFNLNDFKDHVRAHIPKRVLLMASYAPAFKRIREALTHVMPTVLGKANEVR